jgi:hypothetical protein
MIIKILKILQVHLIAIAAGFILTIAFFNPLFYENKSMNQNDVFQGVGSGQEVVDYRLETGEEALWTNRMFSGMPAYLINISWTGDFIKHIQQIITLNFPSAAQVTILAFLSCYFMLLIFKVRPWLAFIGAIAFSFNTFSIISIEAGHIWKVRAMAYMPLVLGAVHLLFNSQKRIFALGFLSLAAALEIQANHLQITYYLFLLLLIYGVFQVIEYVKSKQLPQLRRHLAILSLAALLGIGANTGRLWTTFEYSKYSTRGSSELTNNDTNSKNTGLERDYVFNWSYGILESFTFLVPNFSGGASQQALKVNSNLGKALSQNGLGEVQVRDQLKSAPTYWGNQPLTAGPTYLGAIMCFLFVLGIFTVEARVKNWILVVSLFSILLAWGKNLEWFNYTMYDYFPGYNKFRSVSMAIVSLLVCVPLMAMLGLEKTLQSSKKDTIKPLLMSAGITGGIALLLAVFSGFFSFKGAVDAQLTNVPEWFLAALKQDRQSLLKMDALRTFVLIGLAFGLLYAYGKEKINMTYTFLGLTFLVLFDFWKVDRRYVNDENFERQTTQNFLKLTDADQFIIQNAGIGAHYRTLNLLNPFNEAKTSAHHSSLGGYHGAKLRRYQELIEYCLSPELSQLIGNLQGGSRQIEQFSAINMLNAQYLKFGDQSNQVLPNSGAYGNAWFIEELISVNNADDELVRVCELEDQNTAVINTSKFRVNQTNYTKSGTIKLLDYLPNYLKYETTNDQPSFAVFSEIYYSEGWRASIDGVPSEIKQVNYVLRGLEIPPNAKEIIFEFKPDSYFIGNKITALFSALTLVFLVAGIYLNIKNIES